MRKKNEINDPLEYFKGWHFNIQECYWSLFGVRRTRWVDVTKTKPARQAYSNKLVSQGYSTRAASSTAVEEIVFFRCGWGVFAISGEDFSPGYVFQHASSTEKLQIIENKDGLITYAKFLTALNRYDALFIQPVDFFVKFLKTGMLDNVEKISPKTLLESDLKYLLIQQIENYNDVLVEVNNGVDGKRFK